MLWAYPISAIVKYFICLVLWALILSVPYLLTVIFPITITLGALVPIVTIHYIQLVVLTANAYCDRFIYGDRLESLFDSVLARIGHPDVVTRGRMFHRLKWGDITTFKRKMMDVPDNYLIYPLTLPNRIFNFLILFVPIIGPWILIFAGAPDRGFQALDRYYQLKGINTRQKNAFYASRRWQFITYGIVLGILEQIPLASPLFVVSKHVSAALWAGRCEERFAEQSKGIGIRYTAQQNRGAFIMGPV